MNYEWKYCFGKFRKEVPCVSNTLILDPGTHVRLRLLAGIQTCTVGNWQQNISVSWRRTDYHTDVFESKCKWETTKNISIRPYALAGQNICDNGRRKMLRFKMCPPSALIFHQRPTTNIIIWFGIKTSLYICIYYF